MPYGDGTGPSGMGRRTGRGFGYCIGFNHPGYVVDRGYGRGMGRGFGFRMGFGPGFGHFGSPEPYDYSPDQEKEYLKSQISGMEKTIQNLQKRLDEIDKKK